MTTIYGLSTQILPAEISPVVDVVSTAITAAYTTQYIVASKPITLLVIQNTTNVTVDVGFYSQTSGLIQTGFHILAGESLTLNFKTNYLTLSANSVVYVKATSTLPSSGMVSFSSVVVPS